MVRFGIGGMIMCKIFGYCRISRKTQSIDRQVRNILAAYPKAIMYKEAFTGTKIQGRKALDALLKQVKREIRLFMIPCPE